MHRDERDIALHLVYEASQIRKEYVEACECVTHRWSDKTFDNEALGNMLDYERENYVKRCVALYREYIDD